MKNCGLLFLTVMILFACQNKRTNKVEVTSKTFIMDSEKQELDTVILGEKDTAIIVKDKLDTDDTGGKKDRYEINIMFANKKWPTLKFSEAIGADLYVVDDIDGDHKPELLLRPEWFSSCWSSINLFSLKEGAWKIVKKGSMYFCADEYPLSKRIEKHHDKYYLLTDSLADDQFVIQKQEIKF
ncbi:hypothetical protein [Pedobacter sp.]|uniref:hypothetical protein n=1 Tax=Pedobacter sp. TaxID=1411316 RepID=UPI0031D7723E